MPQIYHQLGIRKLKLLKLKLGYAKISLSWIPSTGFLKVLSPGGYFSHWFASTFQGAWNHYNKCQ